MTIEHLLAEIEARAKAEEAKSKHWDGEVWEREHHMGCGHGSSVCPGEPDWTFARTDIPRLVAALRVALAEIGEDYEDGDGEPLLPKIELALKGVDNA